MPQGGTSTQLCSLSPSPPASKLTLSGQDRSQKSPKSETKFPTPMGHSSSLPSAAQAWEWCPQLPEPRPFHSLQGTPSIPPRLYACLSHTSEPSPGPWRPCTTSWGCGQGLATPQEAQEIRWAMGGRRAWLHPCRCHGPAEHFRQISNVRFLYHN